MLHTQQGSSAIRLARPLRVFRLLSISSAIRRIGSPLTRSRNHGRLRNRHPVVLHSYGPGDTAIWGNKGRGSVDLIGSSELDVTDVLDQGPCVLKAVNTRQAVCEGSFWIFFCFTCVLSLHFDIGCTRNDPGQNRRRRRFGLPHRKASISAPQHVRRERRQVRTPGSILFRSGRRADVRGNRSFQVLSK